MTTITDDYMREMMAKARVPTPESRRASSPTRYTPLVAFLATPYRPGRSTAIPPADRKGRQNTPVENVAHTTFPLAPGAV